MNGAIDLIAAEAKRLGWGQLTPVKIAPEYGRVVAFHFESPSTGEKRRVSVSMSLRDEAGFDEKLVHSRLAEADARLREQIPDLVPCQEDSQ